MADKTSVALRYVGKGRWIAGIPARDLTHAEVERWPEAEASRLYQDARVLPQGEFLPESED